MKSAPLQKVTDIQNIEKNIPVKKGFSPSGTEGGQTATDNLNIVIAELKT